MMEMATAKVSIAIPSDDLRLARRAAAEAGLSLSAFFSRAVRSQLEEHRREQAARELLGSFEQSEMPTLARQQELLAQWSRPRAKPAANKRRSRR
jgi:hypothetical protein